jgi:hypothetical protein
MMFPVPEKESGVFHDINHAEFAIRTNGLWLLVIFVLNRFIALSLLIGANHLEPISLQNGIVGLI